MACGEQSGWLTVVQVGAAALTPIIALVGGWIAWQQVRINRNKLKLDRFDKRFAIHEAAMTFVAGVTALGNAHPAQMNEYLANTRGARFLLNKETADYLDEIHTKASRLHTTITVMQSLVMTEEWRTKHSDRWLELTEWFQAQIREIPEKFAPFLSVDDI